MLVGPCQITESSNGNAEIRTNQAHDHAKHTGMNTAVSKTNHTEHQAEYGFGDLFDEVIRSSQHYTEEAAKAQQCTKVRENEEADDQLFKNSNADTGASSAVQQARENERRQMASSMQSNQTYRANIASLDQKLNQRMDDKLREHVYRCTVALADFSLNRFQKLAAQNQTRESNIWAECQQQGKDMRTAVGKIEAIEKAQEAYLVEIKRLRDSEESKVKEIEAFNSEVQSLKKSHAEQTAKLSEKLAEQTRLRIEDRDRLSEIRTGMASKDEQYSHDLSETKELVKALSSDVSSTKSTMDDLKSAVDIESELCLGALVSKHETRVATLISDVKELQETTASADHEKNVKHLEQKLDNKLKCLMSSLATIQKQKVPDKAATDRYNSIIQRVENLENGINLQNTNITLLSDRQQIMDSNLLPLLHLYNKLHRLFQQSPTILFPSPHQAQQMQAPTPGQPQTALSVPPGHIRTTAPGTLQRLNCSPPSMARARGQHMRRIMLPGRMEVPVQNLDRSNGGIAGDTIAYTTPPTGNSSCNTGSRPSYSVHRAIAGQIDDQVMQAAAASRLQGQIPSSGQPCGQSMQGQAWGFVTDQSQMQCMQFDDQQTASLSRALNRDDVEPSLPSNQFDLTTS